MAGYHNNNLSSGRPRGANSSESCHDNTGAVLPCKRTVYGNEGQIIAESIYKVSLYKRKKSEILAQEKTKKFKNNPKGGCMGCHSKTHRTHKHHVTYKPSNKVKLCVSCHAIITAMNTEHYSKVNRPLNNEERITIFRKFLSLSHQKKDLSQYKQSGHELFNMFNKRNKLDDDFMSICKERIP